MAIIRPFRALRPVPSAAAAAAAVLYDVVSTGEARRLAADNPLSFLHVSRAEIDLPADIDPYSAAVYELAARNLQALIDRTPLVVEAEPSLYLYRMQAADHEQTGLVSLTYRATAAFADVPAVYIADGHHRIASAARARDELSGGDRGHASQFFLGVAFPDSQVRILAYNRTVANLAGRTPAEFLAALRARFPVAGCGPPVPPKGQAAMYLDGVWHAIDLATAKTGRIPGKPLDIAILQDQILAPVTTDELLAISDAGGVMSPKSIWFEPKLRDGLLIHQI